MRATLVYDGDCGICTRLARVVTARVRAHPGDFTVIAHRDVDLEALGVSARQCAEALQWVAADGRVSSAQDAVARTLLAGRPCFRPLGGLILVPGVHALAGAVYRWVARHRHRLPGGTPACSPTPADSPTSAPTSAPTPALFPNDAVLPGP